METSPCACRVFIFISTHLILSIYCGFADLYVMPKWVRIWQGVKQPLCPLHCGVHRCRYLLAYSFTYLPLPVFLSVHAGDRARWYRVWRSSPRSFHFCIMPTVGRLTDGLGRLITMLVCVSVDQLLVVSQLGTTVRLTAHLQADSVHLHCV